MKNAIYFRGFPSWISALAVLGLFLLALSSGNASAANADRKANFDHVKTGFPLSGAHAITPCESCHVQGTFKGTPKKCATCHTQGSRVQASTFKPANHMVTTQPCEQCHSSTASWSVAFYSHVGVTPHQCSQCHNNNTAKGKPSNHIVTSEPCDNCHRTTTWMSASFTHISVVPGSCVKCHTQGGQASTFKPSNHIPTGSTTCDQCHNTTTFNPSSFKHSAIQGVVPGQCETCHNGAFTSSNALGKAQASPPHVITSASCDTCHTGYSTFAGANQHVGVIASAGTCANAGCHVQGGAGLPKPGGTGHIPTGALTCNICHNMTTFNPSTFTHSAAQGVVAGQCAISCHSGTYAALNVLGKPGGTSHIPTASATCDQCHNTTTFVPSSFTHSATQGVVAGQCETCHSGTYASLNVLGKAQASPPHIITSASCDTCHTGYSTFAGAGFNHTGVAPGTCANAGCHIQGGAGKVAPSNHIPYQSQLLAGSSMSCDACHTSTSTFTAERMNHNNSQGNGAGWCKGCHQSGTNYLGNMDKKSLSHYEKYAGQADCSSSGCHRPLGTRGTAYSRWTN